MSAEERRETFREFFERTRHVQWPGAPSETVFAVQRRAFEALADWADEIARRAEAKR